MSPRQRSSLRWLDDYPNLSIARGIFHIRTPHYINVSRPQLSLVIKYDGKGKTGKAAKDAIAIYIQIIQTWNETRENTKTRQLLNKIEKVTNPLTGDGQLFRDYLEYYRISCLPTATKRKKKPLGERTKKDYDGNLRLQLGNSKNTCLDKSISRVTLQDLRSLLAPWLNMETTFNHLRAVLLRVFQQAVDEGLRPDNPVKNIETRDTAGREQYITDDAYLAITGKMELWEAKTCDLLYLVLGRPANALSLNEQNVVKVLNNGHESQELHFTGEKTNQPIELEISQDLEYLLQWFRDWKRNQNIISDHFVVYPLASRPQSIGKPVSREHISRKFSLACIKCGFWHWEEKKSPQTQKLTSYKTADFKLQDIRPKAITDENIKDKTNNKGAHRSESGRRIYIRLPDPIRMKTNVSLISERQSKPS